MNTADKKERINYMDNFIIVLDDGETFSALQGCKLIKLTEKEMEQVNNGEVKAGDIGEQFLLEEFFDGYDF